MRYMIYGWLATEIGHSMYTLGQMYINEGHGLHPFIGGTITVGLVALGIAWCYTERKESSYV